MKRQPNLTSGFTLIELLIVIAIILILIAIALPNFLEAQLRAKTTKSQSEMRTLATAIESLRAERGVLLIDFWDDHTLEANLRINEVFGGVGHWIPACSPTHPDGRSMTCVLMPLTSPVQYMTSIPDDVLAPTPDRNLFGNKGHDEWIGHVGNRTYLYADREGAPGKPRFGSEYDFNTGQFPTLPLPGYLYPLRTDEWVLSGFGPGRENNLTDNSVRKPFVYSPTNGTRSVGSIYYRSTQGIAH
ncbi:MAG: prepilin-type N-terminal cleavage/methylation domain-containing protein [Candidatus Omnitrophica bacterium]|nr:prepilin-type N-terminal cleavage/methylation domain-containing protein [Candidatus Omnitrophota bacterium]MCB9783316.1 prepilin-type N-terminal cleavage/methylation domain-containing protein [Candidatus Omnitrophota bacterium]